MFLERIVTHVFLNFQVINDGQSICLTAQIELEGWPLPQYCFGFKIFKVLNHRQKIKKVDKKCVTIRQIAIHHLKANVLYFKKYTVFRGVRTFQAIVVWIKQCNYFSKKNLKFDKLQVSMSTSAKTYFSWFMLLMHRNGDRSRCSFH